MWNKVKRKLTDWCVNIVAYGFVASITLLLFIVPITVIASCIKLILMMFGV